MRRPRVAHVTTVDVTLRFLLLPQLRRLRDEGYEVTTISAPGPWVSDLEREGIRHIPWPGATRAWDPWADLRAIRHLLGILRRERFDVVHTHNPKPGFIGRLAARMVGTPVVVNTVHGLWATPDDRVRRRLPVLALEWLAARFSHMELYQSEEDLRWARQTRVARRERSILLGNGTDLRHFHPEAVPPETVARLRAELGIPEDALVVGIVARMVAEKGYREFLETARTLRSTSPEVRFIAVGGWDLEKWDAIGEQEADGASKDVIFAGWRADIRELIALMDVFILPSWREGVPRSAIEAAAMGKAMVLSDIRGCREVARHGIEALLVPPRDAAKLTQAVKRLMADEELRRRLGARARQRVIGRFDERKVEDILLSAYRSLLKGKGLAPAGPIGGGGTWRLGAEEEKRAR